MTNIHFKICKRIPEVTRDGFRLHLMVMLMHFVYSKQLHKCTTQIEGQALCSLERSQYTFISLCILWKVIS